MYRMKQFSAMTGMTQSKIRFYEKQGLVLSQRMENGYRVFTPEDAFRSNAFRMLIQYGFSISEAIEIIDAKQDTPHFRETLQMQQERLARERDLLDCRQRRIQTILKFISSEEELNFKIVDGPTHLYINASHGRNFSVSEKNAPVLAEFYELLNVTACARIIRKDNLLDESDRVDPSYITTINERESHFLSDYSKRRATRLEIGKCVQFGRRITREESVRKETFSDLFAFLDVQGFAIRDDILVLPSFLNLDGEGSDIEVLYVPIMSIEERIQ